MAKKRARPRKTVIPAKPPEVTDVRVDVIDAARGVAIAMMIAYHFCFDLTFFGWAQWPMLADARWIAWRSAIVSTFLLLVGVSLALREQRMPRAPWLAWPFVRRWLQIAAAAVLVTAGSAALFPDTFIYFGVLHFVAVALWACRRAPAAPRLALALAVVALVAGLTFASPAFDPKPVDWIGFAAEKPLTEDYVPLFPWLGVVLAGCGLGGFWARRDFALAPRVDRFWRAVPVALRRTLAFAGRWSLTIYLVHQPLLMGVLAVIRRAT